jgi:DNA-binding transcriptional LysR family regulator
MFIRQLEYLVTLAREKHFARAAEACHVSQPALSSALRTLENELGLEIVERGRRFVGFTDDGQRILGWARQTLASLQHMRHDASAAQTRLVGTLRVGVIPTVMPVTACMLSPSMREHPQIHFELQSLSSDSIHRQLDEYEIDVGLTYLDEKVQAGFNVLPLYVERYVLLSPPGSGKSFEQGSYGWCKTGSLPLGLLPGSMQNRQVINAAFRRENVAASVVLETDSLLALHAHVRHAGIYSVMPHSLLSVLPAQDGVRASVLLPELTRGICLIARSGSTLPPLIAALWRSIEQLDLQARFDALVPVGLKPRTAEPAA